MIQNYILKLLKKSGLSYLCFPKQVAQNLQVMEKDENVYYKQKITYVGGLILAGIMLAAAYWVQNRLYGGKEVTSIERPMAYEEPANISLQAGRQENTFRMEIAPRILSREEADALVRELLAGMDRYILGVNESLEEVCDNLILPFEVEGYPFQIYWESSNEVLIDTNGMVDRSGLEEDTVVMLTAVLCYKDWTWESRIGVLVCQEVLTPEERYTRKLEELLQKSEEENRETEKWFLPSEFDGEALEFVQKKEDYDLLLAAGLCLTAGVAVWIGQDRDLDTSRKKRQQKFKDEYPALVEALALYISAGLNLQMTISYCVQDYIHRRPEGDLIRKCLQELQKDMQNGVSFAEAMERFAQTADDTDYRKLAGILNQGLLNGSASMVSLLKQEAERAREEKRRRVKIRGEQISTALIGPMMLQLGIVIALIMIPAFTGMNF